MKIIIVRAQAGIVGFESPAAEYIESSLSLDKLLIDKPSATYFALVQGSSMQGDGIYDGDLLIVSRAEKTGNYDVIVGILNGEFVCKRLDKDRRLLISSYPEEHYYHLTEGDDFVVEGVVKSSIRLHQKLQSLY